MKKTLKIHPASFLIITIISMLWMSACQHQTIPSFDASDVKQFIQQGDIIRDTWTDTATLPLYLGNGRFASCFGKLGLHEHPDNLPEFDTYGKTQLMHMQHFTRAKFNADYLLPLARIYWQQEPETILRYRQHQNMYEGWVKTRFESPEQKVGVTTWFDPDHRNLLCLQIELSGTPMNVVLNPMQDLQVHYGQQLQQKAHFSENENEQLIRLSCLQAHSSLHVRSNAEVKRQGNQLIVVLKPGSNHILISVNEPAERNPAASFRSTTEWWKNQWNRTGYVDINQPEAQKIWIRTMSQFLCSFNDDKKGLPAPCGLSGNLWPFSFPQDISFIHPVLLHTGHTQLAQAIVEYFSERIPGMQAYTRRFYQMDGIFLPWVMPYGDFEGYHDPVPPNKFYYEIHNSAYLARMAYETSTMVNDPEWTRKHALPLILECALFYENICSKNENGVWDIYVTPSMGQEEHGGMNQKNYLDAIYSAMYCFQKAIELELGNTEKYRQILKDGFAFDRLMSDRGYYYSCEGTGKTDFGEQKVPVQLNPLAYLDVNEKPDPASRKAYDIRYEITRRAKKPYFYGWTLGEFLLAGSRLGNKEEWLRDWNNIEASVYTDPEWIQIFETSKRRGGSYYTTTNGLIAQSLIDNVVSSWWDELETGRTLAWEEEITLKGIRSLVGVTIDGHINTGEGNLVFTAWKDCRFRFGDELLKMKQGEKLHVVLETRSKEEKAVFDHPVKINRLNVIN